MARRQRRIDEAKHEHWRQVLQRWKASGLGVRGFCDRHRLAESQFWWWRRRLGESIEMAPVKSEPAFVPITIVESRRAGTSAAIDIRLTSGHRLRVRAGCDRRLLAEVVALLEGRPC
jgi:transposase